MADAIGYDKFVASYRSLREQHRNDPQALEIIERFGREAAYLRVLDERSAALEAHLAIEKAMQSSRPIS
ncbi:MAG: hypothetical protein FD131_4769 [Rhodocyclaceae bacterium]|nr:MAG: hypothetical protein FD131_4769 [Rhodocyclaceae bacterium]